MHKTKNTLLIIAAVVVVGCLLYVPGLGDLGLYRDDWNNYYTAVVRGPAMLKEHFASDRPAQGWLTSMLFMLFKTHNNAYLIWNLCCRILGSALFALTLLNVWPKTSKMAGIAGILAVIYPGFLQQVDGINYTAHQTAMLCFMISLWLTSLACKPGQKSWNVLYTFISMLFMLAAIMLMEYYIGMEIYRFCIIFLMNRELAQNGKVKAFFKSLLSYIPYLIPAAGFVAWRTFFFNAERSGANMMADVIQPFLDHPLHEVGDLGVRVIKNVWKLFGGVWSVPAYNMLNGLGMKPFIRALIPALVIFAAAQLFLFLLHRKRTDESEVDAKLESAQWLWCGLIGGSVAILPLIIAHRDITFSQSLSLERFSWPGMIGTILFLVGLLGSLKDRSMRNLMTMAVILVSVFVQWQNKVNYIDSWKETKDYWQQVMWRAPGLEQGTTLVTQGGLLIEEDYDIFAPASMIYYPDVKDWSPIAAEVMNSNTIQQIRMGKQSYRIVRSIYLEKDYTKLLAITKPSSASCVHVIDGNEPIYSAGDWTSIPEIGSYSKIDQIITDPEKEAEIPFFLGKELPHGWCYYYEKMELALQMKDPVKAAALADEALAQKLKAEDPVEWIPVIVAYAETGRTDEARSIASKLLANEYMSYTAAEYFSAKENSGAYSEVIDVLKPEPAENEEEPAGEDPAEEPETAETADETAAESLPEEEPAVLPETDTTETETAPDGETAADTEIPSAETENPSAETDPDAVPELPSGDEETGSVAETETPPLSTPAPEEEILLNNDLEATPHGL